MTSAAQDHRARLGDRDAPSAPLPHDRTVPAWPALAYLALLIYGSLLPFDLQPRSAPEAWAAFTRLSQETSSLVSWSDWGLNIALYVPLALLALCALPLRRHWARFAGSLAVVIACIGLSACIEFAQMFLSSRTPLFRDIVANALGAGIGALLAPVAGPGLAGLAALVRRSAARTYGPFPLIRAVLIVAVVPYLLLLSWGSGWISREWLAPDAALARLGGMPLLPFQRAYFADTLFAIRSATIVVVAFIPMGIFAWLLRWAPASGRGLMRRAWAISALASLGLEAGKLFIAGRQPDAGNLLLALAGGTLGGCAAWFLSRARVSGSEAVPPAEVRTEIRWTWRALGLVALAASAYVIGTFPIARPALLTGALIYAVLLWRYPNAWLLVVPALLPVFDLAQWSGRFFLDEFDAAVLLTLAVGYWRLATRSGSLAALPRASTVLLLIFGASLAVSAAVALLPPGPLDANAFSHYYSPYNALRVLKGYAWAVALFPLVATPAPSRTPVGRLWWMGMLLGLAAEILAILWERIVFSGLGDFSRDFRVSGYMSSMHTGGSHVEAYLVLTIPFVLVMSRGRLGWQGALWRTVMFGAAAYALAVTFARGGYIGLVIALAVLLAGWLARRNGARESATLPLAVTASLVAAIVAIPVLTGSFAQSRMESSRQDAGVRFDHWRHVLEIRDTDALSALTGMGLGRFPVSYFYRSPAERRPGSYSFQNREGNPVLALGAGTPIYMEQKVPARHDTPYRLDVVARGITGAAVLNVLLCERNFFDSFGCASATFGLNGDWKSYRSVLEMKWPERLGRPVTLSLENAGPGSLAEIREVRLEAPDGADLVANGTFAQGADRWFPWVFDHLPWHIKNIWISFLFEQGWLGLVAFVLLFGHTMFVLARRFLGTGDPLLLAMIAGMAGFITVGGVDSLFEAPRMTLAFFMTLGMALLVPAAERATTRITAAAREPAREIAPALRPQNASRPASVRDDPIAAGSPHAGLDVAGFAWGAAAGMAAVGLVAVSLPHIPGLPYNVRELLYAGSPLMSAALLAIFWFWLAGVPAGLAPLLRSNTAKIAYLPAVAAHAFVTSLLVTLAVPSESVHDIVGSPIFDWPGRTEDVVRLSAVFALASMALTGGALLTRKLAGEAARSGIRTWLLTTLAVLGIGHWVMVTEAATDNITELLAQGGSLWAFASLFLAGLAVCLAGSALASFAARAGTRGHEVLIALAAGGLAAFGLIHAGTESHVFKYGQSFSAMQFLLSIDRSHLATGSGLIARFAVAYLAAVGAVAFAQRPFFVLFANRRTATNGR